MLPSPVMTETGAALALAFAATMSRIGLFEPAPHLAVAVSGGGDSMALLLLAQIWCQARGGHVTALTVDHRLRAASTAEARDVAGWCRERAIAHVTLIWDGAKPARAIQARARVARYALLEEWCREAGVLHLLLGHHRDDQAETIAMRAAKKSGPDGLAGMAVIAEHRDVRLLRPLLGVAKQDLLGWLRGQGEVWLEDPSNGDPRFERARLRANMPSPSAHPPSPARVDTDRAVAMILARIATVHPEGWVRLHRAGLVGLGSELVAHLLERSVVTVAGGSYPPRRFASRACAAWVMGVGGLARRTLAGCQLIRGTAHLDVLREPAAVAPTDITMTTGEVLWDGRFRIRSSRRLPRDAAPVSVTALGSLQVKRRRADAAWRAAAALPAPRGVDGARTVPHVFYGRGLPTLVSVPTFDVTFRPRSALGGAAFAGLQAVSL